jgi:hypothetical protein
MRFNPPPNWPPAPPGWTPPPGWQPDPSWPPIPPGWQLWVPDAPRRKTGLIVAAALAAVSIDVTGNSATANLTQHGEEPEEIGFVREGGDWKWCDF